MYEVLELESEIRIVFTFNFDIIFIFILKNHLICVLNEVSEWHFSWNMSRRINNSNIFKYLLTQIFFCNRIRRIIFINFQN